MKGINFKLFLAAAAGLFLWQSVAFAEMVQGQVLAVNPEDRSITLQRQPVVGEEEQLGEEINLSVPENAELRGIQSFEEVEIGDEIRAEANKPALGIGSWEARWIEKAEAAAAESAQTGEQMAPQQAAMPGDQGASQQASQGAQGQGQSY